MSWCAQEGVEYLVLVHGFNGAQGNFVLNVTADATPCTPAVFCVSVGACCLADGTCLDGLSDDDCTTIGGTDFFEGWVCAGIPAGYVVTSCSNVFEDISTTGSLALTASTQDDDTIFLGFDFEFFGVTYSQVGIASNGYLTFTTALGEYENLPIPSTPAPNSLIAPCWDDWSPNNGGTVRYQLSGCPGVRRLIVQWTDVPHFQGTGTSTFQVVLNELTDAIEFRYADLSPNSPSVGIENQTGTVGALVPGGGVQPGDCVQFSPFSLPPVVCP